MMVGRISTPHRARVVCTCSPRSIYLHRLEGIFVSRFLLGHESQSTWQDLINRRRFRDSKMASSTSPPPTLSEKYSGIPSNLLEKAKAAKFHVYENQTKVVKDRTKGLACPPGVG